MLLKKPSTDCSALVAGGELGASSAAAAGAAGAGEAASAASADLPSPAGAAGGCEGAAGGCSVAAAGLLAAACLLGLCSSTCSKLSSVALPLPGRGPSIPAFARELRLLRVVRARLIDHLLRRCRRNGLLCKLPLSCLAKEAGMGALHGCIFQPSEQLLGHRQIFHSVFKAQPWGMASPACRRTFGPSLWRPCSPLPTRASQKTRQQARSKPPPAECQPAAAGGRRCQLLTAKSEQPALVLTSLAQQQHQQTHALAQMGRGRR